MGAWKPVIKDHGIGIRTPNGNIKIIVKEIGGTGRARTGRIEVQGSPIIKDGSLVELTQTSEVDLAPDISIKVSNFRSPSSRLNIYFSKPPQYETYYI